MADDDELWMARALAEAERGRGYVEPNPMVGAVVVREGRTIGVGHHARFGGAHAEVEALTQAGEGARGGTLYVTLEPCCHQGKTPPCVDALLGAGVRRVVAAMRDPFPRVAGGGFARLRENGVEVEVGLLGHAARRLNAAYLKRLATGRPYVTAKWAMTLDGKIATKTGDSRWISGPRARGLVHELRGRMDAIVVGIGTVLADDPQLTARPAGLRTPARVVLDSAGRTPLGSMLARTAREAPVWLAVTGRAREERLAALRGVGCEILKFEGEGEVPIVGLLEELVRRGVTNVLVEGGGRVLGAFFEDGQVDEVDVYVAPIIEGGDHGGSAVRGAGATWMADAIRLSRPRISQVGDDARVQGNLPQPWLEAGDPA